MDTETGRVHKEADRDGQMLTTSRSSEKTMPCTATECKSRGSNLDDND